MSSALREGAGLAEEAAPAQYLTFKIAGETYAVGILRVREILQYDTVTKVPSTPRSIRGVMNLRGSVVPVVDLAVKFGLPESPLTARTCVVILEVENDGERMVMGVMADSVSEVIELRAGDIEPPPPFGAKVKVDYLVGMGQADKTFLLVLDIDRVLSAEDLAVASRAGEEVTDARGVSSTPEPTGNGVQPSGEAAVAPGRAGTSAAKRKPAAKTGKQPKARKRKVTVTSGEPADGHEQQE